MEELIEISDDDEVEFLDLIVNIDPKPMVIDLTDIDEPSQREEHQESQQSHYPTPPPPSSPYPSQQQQQQQQQHEQQEEEEEQEDEEEQEEEVEEEQQQHREEEQQDEEHQPPQQHQPQPQPQHQHQPQPQHQPQSQHQQHKPQHQHQPQPQHQQHKPQHQPQPQHQQQYQPQHEINQQQHHINQHQQVQQQNQLHQQLQQHQQQQEEQQPQQQQQQPTLVDNHKLMMSQKLLGNEKYRRNLFDDAVRIYKRANELAKQLGESEMSAILHFNLAMTYYKLGSFDQAADECAYAVKIKDDYFKAHLKRAEIYTRQCKYEEAVICYEHICKLDSRNLDYQILLNNAKEAAKRLKKQDHHQLLGVRFNCTNEDLRKAYRKKALLHHPDRHSDADVVTRRIQEKYFKDSSEAYSHLQANLTKVSFWRN